MFKYVLKSLSDTELVSVASESTNPNIRIESIAAQLVAKSNSLIIIEKNSDEIRYNLIAEVISELSSRLLERDI